MVGSNPPGTKKNKGPEKSRNSKCPQVHEISDTDSDSDEQQPSKRTREVHSMSDSEDSLPNIPSDSEISLPNIPSPKATKAAVKRKHLRHCDGSDGGFAVGGMVHGNSDFTGEVNKAKKNCFSNINDNATESVIPITANATKSVPLGSKKRTASLEDKQKKAEEKKRLQEEKKRQREELKQQKEEEKRKAKIEREQEKALSPTECLKVVFQALHTGRAMQIFDSLATTSSIVCICFLWHVCSVRPCGLFGAYLLVSEIPQQKSFPESNVLKGDYTCTHCPKS